MKIRFFLSLVGLSLYSFAQNTLPVKIEVPQVCTDPNQQFNVLNFEMSEEKGKFSILYSQTLNASVVTKNEFLPDTGSVAYTDAKKKNYVSNSDQALLLVKQTVEENGTGKIDQVWVLSKRKMESAEGYRLYFNPKFHHPIIKTDIPVTLTVHNLDNVKGLSASEYEALVQLVKREFVPETYVSRSSGSRESTLGEDLSKMKEDLQSLRATGLLFRGDLPKEEEVLTRFEVVKDKNFVATKTKGKSGKLKFYLTRDYKKFECMDSLNFEGDLSMTSIQPAYSMTAGVAGAFSNFVLKSKDAAGTEQSQILDVSLDPNDDIKHWFHSVGKNKPSSLQPEVCWFEGNDLQVLSTNGEKFFKPFYQLHQFSKDQVSFVYPKEEEKGTEKFQFVKTFQPEGPVGVAPPLSEKNIPVSFVALNKDRFIITQGFKRDPNTHAEQFLALSVYKISEQGKITGIDNLPGYVSGTPVKMETLNETADQKLLMLYYPKKIQLTFDKNGTSVTPIETNTNSLITLSSGEFSVKGNNGVMLLSKAIMGTKYTVLYYPKAQ